MNFQEYKERIPITTVAESLGYQVNLKKGRNPLEFKHPDGDTVLIDPAKALYYNRNGTNDRGDVIAFVKNRLTRFNVSFQNEIVGINKVLQSYANETPVASVKYSETGSKNFDHSRYEVAKSSLFKLHYLSQERGLDSETIKHFAPFINLVKDTSQATGRPYENIGFPLTKPGNETVVGWDLRNYGFKGVAAGSDRQNGMWIADFAGKPERTLNVFFGENPIDLMSFYQLYKNKLDVDSAAFISFGGGIAKNQMKAALTYWSEAKKHTVFDNDYQGKMYDIAMAVHVSNKNIPLPEKKADSLLFKLPGKDFELALNKISLKAFESASGIRSGITVHKATGKSNGISFKDFNDIIHPKNHTSSQQNTFKH